MKKILLVLTATFLLFSHNALSKIYIWGEFSGWEVGIIEEANFGCYILSPVYDDGSVMKIGYVNIPDIETPFYMYLMNLNWSSINDGDIYPMEINFTPFKSFYDGDALVEDVLGFKALSFKITDPDFLSDFAKKDAMDF